ncbi:hypothetical protein VTK56DRAFT_4892 [Thermocarpiscus australiensis]
MTSSPSSPVLAGSRRVVGKLLRKQENERNRQFVNECQELESRATKGKVPQCRSLHGKNSARHKQEKWERGSEGRGRGLGWQVGERSRLKKKERIPTDIHPMTGPTWHCDAPGATKPDCGPISPSILCIRIALVRVSKGTDASLFGSATVSGYMTLLSRHHRTRTWKLWGASCASNISSSRFFAVRSTGTLADQPCKQDSSCGHFEARALGSGLCVCPARQHSMLLLTSHSEDVAPKKPGLVLHEIWDRQAQAWKMLGGLGEVLLVGLSKTSPTLLCTQRVVADLADLAPAHPAVALFQDDLFRGKMENLQIQLSRRGWR